MERHKRGADVRDDGTAGCCALEALHKRIRHTTRTPPFFKWHHTGTENGLSPDVYKYDAKKKEEDAAASKQNYKRISIRTRV